MHLLAAHPKTPGASGCTPGSADHVVPVSVVEYVICVRSLCSRITRQRVPAHPASSRSAAPPSIVTSCHESPPSTEPHIDHSATATFGRIVARHDSPSAHTMCPEDIGNDATTTNVAPESTDRRITASFPEPAVASLDTA